MAAVCGRRTPGCNAGDGRIGVEEGGQLPATRCGCGEFVSRAYCVPVRPAWQGDTRPLHAQRARIRLAVRGVVEHGKRVMEQILHAKAQMSEVAFRRRRQVRPTSYAANVLPECVIAEPRGDQLETRSIRW